jgi:hypothetical protein
MPPALEIVNEFLQVLDGEKKYEEASKYLVDDFKFTSPKASFKSKEEWIEKFPAFHKNPPIFEAAQPGAHDKQVTRKGKKKISLITLSLVEKYELNEDGKIVSISAGRA